MDALDSRLAEVDARTRSSVRWTNIAPTLLVLWIISTIDKSNISLVIANPQFLADTGLRNQHVLLGWLASGLYLAYGLAAPIWGWAIDRIGARRSAIISLLIWAAACFASGLASRYGTLLISRIALGAGEAAMYPLTVVMVANWFPLKERGRATGFWWIGTMIGPMLAGVVITGLIVLLGWRWQFHALGILAIALPLPMVLFLTTDKPGQHSRATRSEVDLIAAGSIENNDDAPGRIMRGAETSVWRSYRYWMVVVAIASNSLFWWGWATWLPTYLRTARHFSFSASGYLTFVIYGFAVLAILAFSAVSDRIFRRAALAAGGWIGGAVLLVGAAFAPSAGLSVVLIILSLCSQQVGITCGEAIVHSVVKTADMARTQGVRAFISSMVGAMSPVMIGYILHATGGFIGVFVVLAAAVVLAGGCMGVLAKDGL